MCRHAVACFWFSFCWLAFPALSLGTWGLRPKANGCQWGVFNEKSFVEELKSCSVQNRQGAIVFAVRNLHGGMLGTSASPSCNVDVLVKIVKMYGDVRGTFCFVLASGANL